MRGLQTLHFRIDTDRQHDDFLLGSGVSQKIDFDVGGALFLRLTVYNENRSEPCIVDTWLYGDMPRSATKDVRGRLTCSPDWSMDQVIAPSVGFSLSI